MVTAFAHGTAQLQLQQQVSCSGPGAQEGIQDTRLASWRAVLVAGPFCCSILASRGCKESSKVFSANLLASVPAAAEALWLQALGSSLQRSLRQTCCPSCQPCSHPSVQAVFKGRLGKPACTLPSLALSGLVLAAWRLVLPAVRRLLQAPARWLPLCGRQSSKAGGKPAYCTVRLPEVAALVAVCGGQGVSWVNWPFPF